MSNWFDEGVDDSRVLGYLPSGKVYKQAWSPSSNFRKVVNWIAIVFARLAVDINWVFKGLFIVRSRNLIDEWKYDYRIPDSVFYSTDEFEHQKDVFVMKYLMRGNIEWNYKAIANIYDYDVALYPATVYFKPSKLAHKIPHKIMSFDGNIRERLVVVLRGDGYDRIPHQVPHWLGNGKRLDKIKKLYATIKPASVQIIYMADSYNNWAYNAGEVLDFGQRMKFIKE